MKAAVTKQRRPSKKRRPAKKGRPAPAPKATSLPGSNGLPPMAAVLYGPPGVGKTDFCANWPNPYFLIDSHEVGINDLVTFGRCPEPEAIETADDFNQAIRILQDYCNREPGTVVIDSLTGMEGLCFAQCCLDEYNDDWSMSGFYSYQQGPRTAGDRYWEKQFIPAMNRCLHAGHNVLAVAHSEVKMYTDPEGPSYDRHAAYLHKQCWQKIHRWAGAVFFYNYYVSVVKEKGDLKAKPRAETEERQIYTVHTAAYDAKNRFGLPPVIQAGTSGQEAYENFITAYRKCLKA